MAEPKKRLTSARSGARRSHIKAKKTSLANCPKCQAPSIPHRACANCGFYKGADILKLEEKARAKEERRKIREDEEQAAEEHEKQLKKKAEKEKK